MHISVIGLDIAKQVFQVHGVDVRGRAVAQLRLRGLRWWSTSERFHHAWWYGGLRDCSPLRA